MWGFNGRGHSQSLEVFVPRRGSLLGLGGQFFSFFLLLGFC